MRKFLSQFNSGSKFFSLLLFGSFFLEAAGYLAFPYLALQLREQFGLQSISIGQLLLIAIWLRPLFAIFGGWLGGRLPFGITMLLAGTLEAVGFASLAFFHEPWIAIGAIVIGNIGFSIWHPAIFAIVQRLTPLKEHLSQRISALNAALNSGSLTGCFLSTLIVLSGIRWVFVTSGIVFILITLLLCPVFSHPAAGLSAPVDESKENKSIRKNKAWLAKKNTWLLILIGLLYFMSYNQFNSYFSLFANDWLHHHAWTGVSFGVVAIFSFLGALMISRIRYFQTHLLEMGMISCLGLGVGWLLLSQLQWAIFGVLSYLILLGFSEAVMVTYFSLSWGEIDPNQPVVMQSANFAFINVGMGLGSLLGGYIYHSPAVAPSIIGWSLWNFVLLILAAVLCGILKFFQARVAT